MTCALKSVCRQFTAKVRSSTRNRRYLHLAMFSKLLSDKQADWPQQTVLTGVPLGTVRTMNLVSENSPDS